MLPKQKKTAASGFARLAVTKSTVNVIASVAIHHSDFTDYISRGWTATSGFTFLAVTWGR